MIYRIKPFNLPWTPCPICDVGYLVAYVVDNEGMPMHIADCNWCLSELLTLQQSKANTWIKRNYDKGHSFVVKTIEAPL